MRLKTTVCLAVAAVASLSICGGAVFGQDKPKTLVYDGFATSVGAGSYRNHIRLVASGGPICDTVGFDAEHGWTGSTSHLLSRYGRELKHSLLEKTSKGSLGHNTYNGHRCVGRKLAAGPVSTTGVYTLCLLYQAWENPTTKAKGKNGHTTNFPETYGFIGFVPDDPPLSGDAHGGGNDGKRGVSLGHYEDDLCVFAGGKHFVIVEQFEVGKVYLLMAEMTVSKDGPEFIRGFYVIDGDKALTAAKFNEDNSGKGVQIETWSSPDDLARFQMYIKDVEGMFPPQASVGDSAKTDFDTWDEVRLLDGKAVVPVPHIPAPTAVVPQEELLKARPSLPEKLLAYWNFDEGTGETAKDSAGKSDGKTVRCTWVSDGASGKALNFKANTGVKYGYHEASSVCVPHETAVKNDLPWERHHKFTYSAWVRGGEDFKNAADIITKANGAKATERIFADIKGIGFMITGGKLELELTNSINYPQRDNRLKVWGGLEVPGDNKWHHVAVTYDGMSKAAGITFYVDGVKDTKPRVAQDQLDGDVGVTSPLNIGGRDCLDEKSGWSMRGASYALVGDIDEVGVFGYVLKPAEVIAIHSLQTSDKLKYNLAQANALIELHRAGKGSAKIGDVSWAFASGLSGEPGKVASVGGKFSIKLDDSGTGVKSE
ncbi:MAG: LamG domain-containing protein [Planctomycetaceae bacterium]|nr:LamG domain-containing protein [Planctomycetaceae bacterium]